jgi:hypothetical protein
MTMKYQLVGKNVWKRLPDTMAIIYATKSKMLRRIIIPDYGHDHTLVDGTHRALAGETMLVVPHDWNNIASCRAIIERHTGCPSPDYHHALVTSNNYVRGIALVDPELDESPPGARYIAINGQRCGEGYSYDPDSGSFVPP